MRRAGDLTPSERQEALAYTGLCPKFRKRLLRLEAIKDNRCPTCEGTQDDPGDVVYAGDQWFYDSCDDEFHDGAPA